MAYKHVIRAKTKNLFDISKIVESTNLKNNKDGTITVSVYSVAGGLLKNLCPELKVGDVIKVYFQPLRWTAPNPPLVMVVGDVIFDRNGNSRLTVTEKSLNKPVLFYNNRYDESRLPGTTIIGNILITTDLTITNKNHNERYTPYNYLQSNKRMIKVSDVCQLLDKSKVASNTINGLTFTNNGDGTWTVNGTGTNSAWSNNLIPDSKSYNLFGHKLLVMVVCDDDNIVMEFKYVRKDGTGYGFNYYKEHIYTLTEIENYDSFQIRLITLKTGVTFTNTQAIPQLFDLTEMYGAGHEPATVAEFRQRFPNELYPYSPQCWLTSYKSAVVCKTKNLFDVNNAAPYTFNNDNPPSSRISLKDGIYTTTYNNYNVGSGLRIKDGLVLSPGTYTLSLSVITVGETTPITVLTYGFKLYKSDGTKPVITTYTEKFNSRCSHTFTIPADCTDIRLYLAPHCNSGQEYVYISLKDIQIEQGSTATSYVPYQHL